MNERDTRVLELYEKYESCREVADELGVCLETVRRVLIKYDVPRTHRHPKPEPTYHCPSYCDLDVEEIKRLYLGGMTTTEIARKFGCSYTTINRRLKACGVKLRKTGPRGNIGKNDYKELYESGLSTVAIGEKYGCCPQTVIKHLHRLGVQMRPPFMTSPARMKSPSVRKCKECGCEFTAKQDSQKFCSKKCQYRYFSRKRMDRERIAESKYGEDIPLEALYRRDNGKCYICGCSCNWDDYEITEAGYFKAGKTYPTRDHVIPLIKGGTHTWDNVKLACFSCNASKRDKLPQQMGVVAHA